MLSQKKIISLIFLAIFIVTFQAFGLSRVATAAPSAATKRPLKLDFVYIPVPPDSPPGRYWAWFCKEVEKRTNGAVVITFHPGTITTNEVQMWQMIVTGAAALGCPSAGAPKIFPKFELMGLPFLFRDYDHAYKVLDGPIGQEFAREIESQYTVKVLTFYDYGFRHFWGKRPIYKPEDFKGLKLRVPYRPLGDLIAAAGGTPIFMSWGEVVPAAQQGVIDGAELPMANIIAMKIYEVAKYCSLTRHIFSPGFFVMNRDVWKNLTPDEQKVVLQVAKEAKEGQVVAYDNSDKKTFELLEPKGMKVNEVNIKPFIELAIRKVYPTYESKYGKDLIQKIIETK